MLVSLLKKNLILRRNRYSIYNKATENYHKAVTGIQSADSLSFLGRTGNCSCYRGGTNNQRRAGHIFHVSLHRGGQACVRKRAAVSVTHPVRIRKQTKWKHMSSTPPTAENYPYRPTTPHSKRTSFCRSFSFSIYSILFKDSTISTRRITGRMTKFTMRVKPMVNRQA